ncbi:MAG TPA: DUF2017 family protein, partial [Actinomycetota bacterium]|nr:DUF2017 family protein [Actinomycetota bacterium]
MPPFDRRIRRTRKGDYEVRIPANERAVLRALAGELRELLPTDDPSLERLFPPAYADDREKNEEYARLMHDDLLAERTSALDAFERTVDARRLTEEELVAWMGAVNDLRLVLGTRLEVTEEMYERPIDDHGPNAHQMAIYH